MAGDRCDMYEEYRVNAVFRAGRILKIVAASKEPMTSGQIAEAVEISSDIAFRTCITLEELGFLNLIGEAYELGMGLALFWARKKATLEADRDRIDKAIELLNV